MYSVNISTGHSGIAEITAYSHSMKADAVRYNRIFQNPEKKLSDIIELMNSDSEDDKIICDIKDGCDKIIEYPVIQDNETNYQFIVRLAKECGLFLMNVDADNAKCFISDGSTGKSVSVDKNNLFTVNKMWSRNPAKNCSANGMSISLDKFYKMGDSLQITGFESNSLKYNIYDICIELISEKYFYKYTLFEKDNLPQTIPSLNADRIYLEAEVTENYDKENYGRIQVRFVSDKYKDMDSEKGKQWIQWKSPYTAQSGGIIFLPEKNDIVGIIYSRRSFISGGALRKKAVGDKTVFERLNEEFIEPEKNKYISYQNQKRISFTDKDIEIRYKENTVTIDDRNIILSVDKSIISMDKDSISLTVDGNGIVIKKDSVTINCDDKISAESKSIILSGKDELKAGARKAEINGKSEVLISASKISLK
ncbi:MAG: phage baseplate assembly protein V [Ruminococcus sp.]